MNTPFEKGCVVVGLGVLTATVIANPKPEDKSTPPPKDPPVEVHTAQNED